MASNQNIRNRQNIFASAVGVEPASASLPRTFRSFREHAHTLLQLLDDSNCP